MGAGGPGTPDTGLSQRWEGGSRPRMTCRKGAPLPVIPAWEPKETPRTWVCPSRRTFPVLTCPTTQASVAYNYVLTHYFPLLDRQLFEGRKFASSISASPAGAQGTGRVDEWREGGRWGCQFTGNTIFPGELSHLLFLPSLGPSPQPPACPTDRQKIGNSSSGRSESSR